MDTVRLTGGVQSYIRVRERHQSYRSPVLNALREDLSRRASLHPVQRPDEDLVWTVLEMSNQYPEVIEQREGPRPPEAIEQMGNLMPHEELVTVCLGRMPHEFSRQLYDRQEQNGHITRQDVHEAYRAALPDEVVE